MNNVIGALASEERAEKEAAWDAYHALLSQPEGSDDHRAKMQGLMKTLSLSADEAAKHFSIVVAANRHAALVKDGIAAIAERHEAAATADAYAEESDRMIADLEQQLRQKVKERLEHH
jgi:hypothetical protein